MRDMVKRQCDHSAKGSGQGTRWYLKKKKKKIFEPNFEQGEGEAVQTSEERMF